MDVVSACVLFCVVQYFAMDLMMAKKGVLWFVKFLPIKLVYLFLLLVLFEFLYTIEWNGMKELHGMEFIYTINCQNNNNKIFI